MSVKQLRTHIAASGMSDSDCVEKSDLRARAREAAPARRGASGGKPTRQAQQPRTQPAEFGSSGGGGEAGLAPCGHWYAHGQSIHRCLWLQHHGTTLTDSEYAVCLCVITAAGHLQSIASVSTWRYAAARSSAARSTPQVSQVRKQLPEASSLKPQTVGTL